MHPIEPFEGINEHLKSFAAVLVGQSNLLLHGLTGLLEENDFQVLATSRDLDCVLFPDVQPFDGVLLIIQGRQVESALRQIQSFRTMYARGRIAVLLETVRWEDALPFFRAGAHACLPESVSSEIFIKSLEVIMLGEELVSAALPLDVPIPERPASAAEAVPVPLSPQEERILKRIADGDPNKVIARALGVADPTVKVHVKSILRKLGVRNRTQAAMWAIRHGVARQPHQAIAAVDDKTDRAGISLTEDHEEENAGPADERRAPSAGPRP
jgi:two-component system nitrate/nitrite response regulator NarL